MPLACRPVEGRCARRDRVWDLMRRHRRAMRGKAAGAATLLPPDADHGLAVKKQVFAGALKRANAWLEARRVAERKASNPAHLRQAASRRPDAGARPRPGPRPRPAIHGACTGRASPPDRNAQTRHDA
ncbi:hypothetical protein [Roseicella aerolata]|uniref:Uncharacterized protein n=1 Tax=Roseicella aerolata TaxID=2883479 RepID=A0A9X1LBI1_9PROT|nr:hypothetical protein [Roseicella aerolata]MCB4823225.1 hypothetical protein [Roseicella aerolata]